MASGGKNSPTNSAADHGLPHRPSTASTTLWTHLLRSNNSNPAPRSLREMPVIAPPMAPLDKNATSMRILLHDTQANFEKFTTHVGKLFESIQETKQALTANHSLFDRDREALTGDIIDLVNRSQKEIQKSVGQPAQSGSLEELFKDVNHRLQGIDQRVDAIQAFNQTHSQALQTQIQAVQMLLDKQGSILAAVLPLLPLVQAIPLHVDAAMNTLTQKIKDTASFPTVAVAAESSSLPEQSTGKRKRIEQELEQPLLSSPPGEIRTPLNKKHRTDTSHGISATTESPKPQSRESDKLPPIVRQPSAALPSYLTSSRQIERDTDKSSRPGLSPVIDTNNRPSTSSGPGSCVSGLDSRQRGRTFAMPTMITPRRPLGDLPIPLDRRRSTSRQSPVLTLRTSTAAAPRAKNTNAFGRSMTMAAPHPQQELHSPMILGITPTAARPPRMLRMHASISNNVKLKGTNLTFADNRVTSTARNLTSSPEATTKLAVDLAGKSRASAPPVSSIEIGSKRDEFNPVPRSVSRASTVAASPPPFKPSGRNVPLAVALGKMKERRSPVKEGRRFIPLLDSEDEDDDDNA